MSSIESERIHLYLDSHEASTLAYHIQCSLTRSIETNYWQFDDDTFSKNYRKDLDLMNNLATMAYGYIPPHLEDELWTKLHDFRRNSKQETEKASKQNV